MAATPQFPAAADADFVDAEAALGDLDRDFGLEVEAIFLLVSDVVPEVEDAVRGAAEEAGSVDDVGFAFK